MEQDFETAFKNAPVFAVDWLIRLDESNAKLFDRVQCVAKRVADNGRDTVKSAGHTHDEQSLRIIRGDELQIGKLPFDDGEGRWL